MVFFSSFIPLGKFSSPNFISDLKIIEINSVFCPAIASSNLLQYYSQSITFILSTLYSINSKRIILLFFLFQHWFFASGIYIYIKDAWTSSLIMLKLNVIILCNYWYIISIIKSPFFLLTWATFLRCCQSSSYKILSLITFSIKNLHKIHTA